MLNVSELQDTSIKEAEEAEINGAEEIQLRKPNKGFEKGGQIDPSCLCLVVRREPG